MEKSIMFTHRILLAGLVLALGIQAFAKAEEKPKSTEPPKVGDEAPDFTLESLAGDKVTLSEVSAKSPVVLVVLRGFPGYQCPICSRQVAELQGKQNAIKEAGARVLFVHPGPADELKAKAKEFLAQKVLPDHFTMLVDPDYKFTNAYNLRWDAPKETAYPSTFVIDKKRKIRFAEISKTHGGRTKAATVVSELANVE
jgi:peroxiredoxin